MSENKLIGSTGDAHDDIRVTVEGSFVVLSQSGRDSSQWVVTFPREWGVGLGQLLIKAGADE